jgi:hypothetical protein
MYRAQIVTIIGYYREFVKGKSRRFVSFTKKNTTDYQYNTHRKR